jgi:hypothetical protein
VIARDENGASGGGLITAVQPAASAAPSLRVIMAEGKFHGVIIALFYNEDARSGASKTLLHDAWITNIHETRRM